MTTYQLQSYNYMTSDPGLLTNDDYKRVARVMDTVMGSGAVSMGAGSCIGLSRLIYAALKNESIGSRLMECQVTYTLDRGTPEEKTYYLGFDDIKNPGEIDTHVLVITETNPPLVIDASLTHRYKGVLIDKVNNQDTDGTFATYFFEDKKIKCLYQLKTSQKVPLIQQLSFVDRMQTDERIFGRIKLLKTLIMIALLVSTLNALRGFYDHYEKYIDTNNYWGPDAIERLDKKIDLLSKKIDESQKLELLVHRLEEVKKK